MKIHTENNLTPAKEKIILKAAREARKNKNVTHAMTPKVAIKYLKTLGGV